MSSCRRSKSVSDRERARSGSCKPSFQNDRLLPLSLLDAVLGGSPDPEMIGAGYIVSQTDIRFIESKYGRSGLRKLLDALREGKTTEQALTSMSGKSLERFEGELREWGRSERRVFDNPSVSWRMR